MRATHPQPVRVLSLVLAAGLAAACSARAEMDFEYGQRLMEADKAEFRTNDLVERLVANLEKDPATQWDGKLLEATYKRQLAKSAFAELRAKLLDESDTLYKDYLAKAPKDHRLREKAEESVQSLLKDRVQTSVKAAQEAKDPVKAKALREQAKGALEEIAKPLQAVLTPNYEKYRKLWEEVMAKPYEGDFSKVPPKILAALDLAFDEWVVPDKRYISVKTDQLECFADSDPAKKAQGEELIKHCDKSLLDDGVLTFPLNEMYYHFMKGKVYAQLGEEEKAAEAWQTALAVSIENPSAEQQRYVLTFKTSIFQELIKMRMKAQKYEGVIRTIYSTLRDPDAKTRELVSKPLILQYAQAIALYPEASAADYEEGLRTLRDLILKEEKTGGTGWAADFYVAMSDVLDGARARKIKLRLAPDEWFYSAHGYFMAGEHEFANYQTALQEEPPKAPGYLEKARDGYEKAVRFYQAAISAVRASRGDPIARLKVEPKCWMEIGYCHYRMKNYMEALIAFTSLLDDFTKDKRAKWLPDPAKPEGKKFYTPAVQELLAALDAPRAKKGLMDQACGLTMLTLSEVTKLKTPWAGALRLKTLEEYPELTKGSDQDPVYVSASGLAERAKAALESARNTPDAKAAEKLFRQAADQYVAAAEKYLSIKPESKSYESGLWQGALDYSQAKGIWGTGRMGVAPGEPEQKVAELSKKGLEALDRLAKCNPETSNLPPESRKEIEGAALFTRISLCLGVKDWAGAVAKADEYLAWEENNAVKEKVASEALLNKFIALLELARGEPPQNDSNLKKAEAAMEQYRQLKPNDAAPYFFMVENLRGRYAGLANDARKVRDLGVEVVERYQKKSADLQLRRLALMEKAAAERVPGAEAPTLDEYFKTMVLLRNAGDNQRAIECGQKLLARFDPENKACRIPDEPTQWKGILDRMLPLIRYDDLAKSENCRKDHAALVDLMYDTPEGMRAGKDLTKRPKDDQHPVDLEKALQQVQTIQKTYWDCQTLKPQFGPQGKSWIEMIKEEIDYRRTVLATRDLILSMCKDAATQLSKDPAKAEEARKYRDIANGIIRFYLNENAPSFIQRDSLGVQLLGIDLYRANGEFDKALKELRDLKERDEVKNSPSVYFDVSKAISLCLADMNRWKEAVEYPEFLALTAGLNAEMIRVRWPDLKAFLVQCYEKGVPMSPAIKAVLEAKPAPAPGVKDQPKGDAKAEPKADAGTVPPPEKTATEPEKVAPPPGKAAPEPEKVAPEPEKKAE